MKIKKQFLSALVCIAMLVGIFPTGIFAAEWVPSSETDGVGEYYEYIVNASDITPDATDGLPIYDFTVPAFNDVGDIIAIKFKDVAPADKTYSSYIKRSDVYCNNDAESLEYLKSMIDGGHPDAAQLATNLANGYKNTIVVSMPLYDQSNISDCSYALKINNKLYKAENDTLVEITTPVAYPTLECISWNVDSHNSVLGTSLPEKMFDDPTTIVDMSQTKLNNIGFQLYYKGSLVETYKLDKIYTNPIEYNKTFTYTITYKLNADGTVTATAPASSLISPEAYIQYTINAEYTSCGNKTSDDSNWIYNFTDASQAENIRVTSISANANKLQTTFNVTNISAILEYYKTSDINPDDVTDADKPEDDSENSGDPLIKPAPDYDINPPSKEDDTPANDKEDETPANDKEDETTTDSNDTTTEIKDVTLTEDNKAISKDDMSTLITENATKDIVIKTPAGITLTFAKGTMKAVDGKDTYNFGVSISDDYSKQSDMGAVTKDNFVSLIDFEYSGNLPAEATIKIPVGADRAGQTLYYLLKTDTGYTLIQSAKVDNEGYITVKQDHCSTYVITTVDVSEKATVDKNDETTADKNNETVPETETKKDTDTKKPDKDNNAVIYIVIVVIVVAVIAGVVVFVIYKKRKNETIEDITEDSIEETTENKTEE